MKKNAEIFSLIAAGTVGCIGLKSGSVWDTRRHSRLFVSDVFLVVRSGWHLIWDGA